LKTDADLIGFLKNVERTLPNYDPQQIHWASDICGI